MENIDNVFLCIDDLIIHTRMYEEHLATLDKALQRAEENNMKINKSNCHFSHSEVISVSDSTTNISLSLTE
jgi:hypothetical protein